MSYLDSIMPAIFSAGISLCIGWWLGESAAQSWWKNHLATCEARWKQGLKDEEERRQSCCRIHENHIARLEDEQAKLKNRLDIITNVANYDPEE